MNEMRLMVGGERLDLHAERAVYWRQRKCLLLADVHFGKGSVLRRAGISVPTGQTAGDLTRLDGLIGHYRPAQLIVLGDLVHGDAPRDAPWIGLVNAWRQRHASLEMTLIAGNHDRHFDARELGFDVVGDELSLPPFLLRHAPAPVSGSYVLAGHVHPGVTVHDGWRRHRLPAFRFTTGVGLLPSFGALTGLHETHAQPDERIVAITPGGLVPLGPDAADDA
ncbi:MAG: ligase-associated DNA damage response endonuclease PdeM [Rhodanobacter sp.]